GYFVLAFSARPSAGRIGGPSCCAGRPASHVKEQGPIPMTAVYLFVILCGLVAIGYGVYTSRAILAADAGNERMQQIAAAVQEGAGAYLNRQYTTIGIVGIVIFVIL